MFILQCIFYCLCWFFVAFLFVIGIPFAFMKAGVLLEGEYIFRKVADKDDEDEPDNLPKRKVKKIIRRKKGESKTSTQNEPASNNNNEDSSKTSKNQGLEAQQNNRGLETLKS